MDARVHVCRGIYCEASAAPAAREAHRHPVDCPQASGPARRGQRSVGGLRGAIPKVRQERREKPPPSSVGASVDGLMPTLAGLGFCLTESADAGAHFTWKHPGRTQDSV